MNPVGADQSAPTTFQAFSSAIYLWGSVHSSRRSKLNLTSQEVIVRQKIFVALVLVVLLLGSSLLFSSRFSHSARAEQQLQPMSVGSQPPLVKVSRQLGADRSNRTLQMSIGLSLRNSDQLHSFLQNLYDPSSASYHQFLSVEQFASEFAPTVAQEQ